MLRNGGVALVSSGVNNSEFQEHAHSCDADDEETHERVVVFDDQPLDMTFKKDQRKRALESNDEESKSPDSNSQDVKKIKCSSGVGGAPSGKRKLLRKKRYHKRVSDAQVNRPSVISFAGSSGNYTSSSSNEEIEEDDSRARRRKKMSDRKKLFVHADVEEHFRRSLGGVLYDLVNKQERNTPEESRNSIHSSAEPQENFANEVIRPSDVDDHFAKALGTETWSKIVNNSRAANSSSSTPPLQDHRTPPPPLPAVALPLVTSTVVTPPPPALPPTIQSSKTSNSYKIESILGTSVSERPTIKQPPVYENTTTRRSPPPPYTTNTSTNTS